MNNVTSEPQPTSADLARYRAVGMRTLENRNLSDVHCAFISGSLIEGYGNAASDVDVFVVTIRDTAGRPDSLSEFDFGDFKIEMDIDDTEMIRTDTELWSIEVIRDIANSISACADDWARSTELPEQHLKFAHKLRTAVGIHNSAKVAELKELFKWEQVARVQSHRALLEYVGYSEDAAGAIRAEDDGTAMITSRLALGWAIDAFIGSQGVTTNSEKWRCRKLATLNPGLLAEYLAADASSGVAHNHLIDDAKRRVRTATEFAHRAQATLRLGQGDE